MYFLRWRTLCHLIESHDIAAKCVWKLHTEFGRKAAPSAPYVKKKTHTLKSRDTQKKFRENFCPAAWLDHFSSKITKKWPLRYRVILIEFLYTQMKEDDIVNILFQQEGAVDILRMFWRLYFQIKQIMTKYSTDFL